MVFLIPIFDGNGAFIHSCHANDMMEAARIFRTDLREVFSKETKNVEDIELEEVLESHNIYIGDIYQEDEF